MGGGRRLCQEEDESKPIHQFTPTYTHQPPPTYTNIHPPSHQALELPFHQALLAPSLACTVCNLLGTVLQLFLDQLSTSNICDCCRSHPSLLAHSLEPVEEVLIILGESLQQ